ncbi:hypothetical protein DOTSEDRAFT_38439 [Dothistroma septosporum NZE10]|uniref:Uncharacterized protein n=1 Tax=Dothistroma septosporum (strain NZE10 / CBS 128990) TaxID=675120 RepID=M2XIC1_DOTSN|nr:hypothetical protein DOTSEDRAFT_38439 [Dothistroma septosporum NZE10]
MGPRKPQSWTKVRAAGIAANKVNNLSATPQSAWRALTHSNNEHEGRTRALIDRNEMAEELEEAEDDTDDENQGTKRGKKGKATAKSKPKPKPKPRKITKSTTGRIGKSSNTTTRSNRRNATIEDHHEPAIEVEEEFWRPYGGGSPRDIPPGTCIGLARISTWQCDNFKATVMEVLEQYAPGEAEVEAEEWKHGGESVSDVMARFGSVDQATIIKGQIEGEMVMGRKLQVGSVHDS